MSLDDCQVVNNTGSPVLGNA